MCGEHVEAMRICLAEADRLLEWALDCLCGDEFEKFNQMVMVWKEQKENL